MVTQWQVNVTYPRDIDSVKVEQMQEHAIKAMRDRCPHIIENELEIHYSKPILNPNETITQQLSVECEYCENSNGY